MAWDLRPLREDVVRCFGRDQLSLLNPCLRSVGDRRDFAQYHFGEAQRFMNEVIGSTPPVELVATLLGAYDKKPGEFDWARFQAAAHTIACVQNMHAFADSLAHTVYFSLGMNLDPATSMRPKAINIVSVKGRAPAGEIQESMQTLIDDPGFTYLSALNNHGKHRSIVTVAYSVDTSGEDELPHGLKFGAFEYEGQPYPQRWVKPTLIAEYERQEILFHRIGRALNAALVSRPPSPRPK